MRLTLLAPDIVEAMLDSQHDAVILEVGTRIPREGLVHYPGIDLMAVVGRPGYSHTDGTPYQERSRASEA